MKFPNWLKVYGDMDYRGDCPKESLEQVTFFNWLKMQFPGYGRIALHVRNEGKLSHGQVVRYKSEGMCAGASDIIIPAKITFVCEMKRADHTKCKWGDEQLNFLEIAQSKGAFVCVALGFIGAKEAFMEYFNLTKEQENDE